ncbi:MAG: hypothetical protein RR162_01160 [Oscillospiraceae bacterium]
MNSLSRCIKKAEQEALKNKCVYTLKDETYYFVCSLFQNDVPKKSTFQGEAICLLLIRDKAHTGTGQAEFKSYFIQTYLACRNENGGYSYNDNFQHITGTIKELANLQEQEGFNFFMSYNSFRKPEEEDKYRRKQIYAYRSTTIGIDLDFYKIDRLKNLSVVECLKLLHEEKKDEIALLHPMIVISGGGCQLYVKLKKDIIHSQYEEDEFFTSNTDLFKKVSVSINNLFLDFGADSHCKADSSRVFRVPGCKSLKYSPARTVNIYERFSGNIGTQKIINKWYEEEVVKVKQPKPPKIKQERVKKYRDIKDLQTGSISKNQYKMYHDIVEIRLDDLKRFIKLQKGELTGYRNDILYISTAILATTDISPEDLFLAVYDINNSFSEPMETDRIEDTMFNVLENKRVVTNEFIYNAIYKPLDADLSLMRGRYTPEAQQAAKDNLNGKRAHIKKYSREEKKTIILNSPQLTNAALAEILNCSERNVRRIRNLP